MRPRRLYIEPDTKKPYYIVNGKKKYVKVPKGVSLRQLQKVNIRNIINIPMARRIKRRRKKVVGKFQQKINGSMKELTVGGLPLYLFQEKKEIPELSLAGREKKKPELTLVPSSSTLTPPKPPQLALPIPLGIPIEAPVGEPETTVPPTKEPKNPVGRPKGSVRPEGNNMSVEKIKSLILKNFTIEKDYEKILSLTKEDLDKLYKPSSESKRKYISRDSANKAIEKIADEFLASLGKG